MSKTNLWIIWAWEHMKSHISWLVDIPEINISWIVDPWLKSIDDLYDSRNPEVADRVNKLLSKATLYKSEEDMYEEGWIDAIMSWTPDRFHFSNLKKAIDNWAHAFVEKPLVTTTDDLVKLAEYLKLADEKKLILTSCHIRRYDAPFLWIKENLGKYVLEFWNILNINYDFAYVKPREFWLHIWLLMDHFNHEIDLLNFLLGYADFKAEKFFDTEDRYNVWGIRYDWVAFNFNWTRLWNTKNYPEFIEIRFERWSLRLYTKDWKILVHNFDTWIEYEWMWAQVDYAWRLAWVNRNFVNAILWKEWNYLTKREMYVNTASSIALTSSWTYDSKKDEILKSL